MAIEVDPITLQVLTSAAYSIVEEMSVALIRTSRSTNIKDRRDASCALYDTAGAIAVISQSEIGTPLHLGVMGAAVGTAAKQDPRVDAGAWRRHHHEQSLSRGTRAPE